MRLLYLRLFSLILFGLPGLLVKAQISENSSLFKTLKTNDSLCFDIGFNHCDLSQFDKLTDSNFEFYHDQGGATYGKAAFIESIRKNICSISYHPRRELVEGTLQVYPLYHGKQLYAAIQTGRHRFYAVEKGRPDKLTSIAQFTTLWVKNGNTWQMKRILSYDHHDDPYPGEYEMPLFNHDSAIKQWIKENHVPCLGIGIINNGKLKDIKVFGEIKKGDPAPYNTIFSVASLTKPITSMLTLKLVGLGLWNLDEPLDKYWIDPDLKKDPRHSKLTTRIILSHQTGFPNWRYLAKDSVLRFEFDPGTKYQYSGEGFEYLRHALEHKFHLTLDRLADSLIFKPLSMRDTRYVWSDELDTNRLARGFDGKGKMYRLYKNKEANAADNVRTTVADYGAFVTSLMDNKIFSNRIFDQMISHQVQTKTGKYMGLGWEVYDLGGGTYAIGHGGNENGVHCQVFLLPQSKKGIIIFTNVDDGYKLYIRLIEAYMGEAGKKIVDLELK